MGTQLNRTDYAFQEPGAPTQTSSGTTFKPPPIDDPLIIPLNENPVQLNVTEAQVSATAKSKFENTFFGKAIGATTNTIKGAIQAVQNTIQAAQNAVDKVTGTVENTINTATDAVEDNINTVEDTVSGVTNVVEGTVSEVGSAVLTGAATGATAGAIIGTLSKKSGVQNKIGKAVAIGAAAGAGVAVAGKVISGVRSKLNPKGITPDAVNKKWSPDKFAPESIVGKVTDPITGTTKSVTDAVNTTSRTVGDATQAVSTAKSIASSVASGAIIGGVTGGVVGGLVNKSGVKNKVGNIAKATAVGVGVGAGLGALQNRLNVIKNTPISTQSNIQPLPKPQISTKPPTVNGISEQRVKIVEVKKQQTDETYPIVTREPLKYSYISKLTGKPVVDEDFTGTKAKDLPPLPEWATKIPVQVSNPRYVPEFPDYYEQNKYGQTVIVKTAFSRPSIGNLVKYTTKELIE